LTPSKLSRMWRCPLLRPKQTSVWHTVSGSLRTRLKTSCGCIRRDGVSVQRWNENADVRLAPGYQARSSYRAHRRQERMELTLLAECILESPFHFSCYSRSSSRVVPQQWRLGREWCRIGLFDRKRKQNRKWSAAEPRRVNGGPPVAAVRHQGPCIQPQERTLHRRDDQRSRPLCPWTYHRCDTSGRTRARLFRTCCSYDCTSVASCFLLKLRPRDGSSNARGGLCSFAG
jgi:hypothetical protein